MKTISFKLSILAILLIVFANSCQDEIETDLQIANERENIILDALIPDIKYINTEKILTEQFPELHKAAKADFQKQLNSAQGRMYNYTVYPVGSFPEDWVNLQTLANEIGELGLDARIKLMATDINGDPKPFVVRDDILTDFGLYFDGTNGNNGSITLVGETNNTASATIFGGNVYFSSRPDNNFEARKVRLENSILVVGRAKSFKASQIITEKSSIYFFLISDNVSITNCVLTGTEDGSTVLQGARSAARAIIRNNYISGPVGLINSSNVLIENNEILASGPTPGPFYVTGINPVGLFETSVNNCIINNEIKGESRYLISVYTGSTEPWELNFFNNDISEWTSVCKGGDIYDCASPLNIFWIEDLTFNYCGDELIGRDNDYNPIVTPVDYDYGNNTINIDYSKSCGSCKN
ncbi:hypothetical protein LDX50_28315 [Fulvivirga sp. 1062]|uniref:Right handed beta helix domain-containing protein n=2 Tax=Fulvivirga sedimenti TaxID=2879465 RepID=A0A9X1L209_9BACT|nr:hypothetical protein [Fulvivirga sedimenti]